MIRVRVQIVDDSLVARGMLRRILGYHKSIEIVGSSNSGPEALRDYPDLKPDVVIMDVEMPEMSGLETLQKLLQMDAKAKVIMCSSLTTKGADTTFKAMSLGALDYIGKPVAGDENRSEKDFAIQLISKVLLLGGATAQQTRAREACLQENAPVSAQELEAEVEQQTGEDGVVLRAMPRVLPHPKVIAIGSSTGGLQPVFDVLKELKGVLDVPVFITQHMPATFTRIFAQHIAEKTGLTAYEAEEGMRVEKGCVYVAPGGMHLEVIEDPAGGMMCHLLDTPAENYCKPSVEPMLRSLLRVYKENIITVILTGMGQDGAQTARELVEKSPNNILIAQDKVSSTVWGMPGAVAKAGLCHALLPPHKIGDMLRGLLK